MLKYLLSLLCLLSVANAQVIHSKNYNVLIQSSTIATRNEPVPYYQKHLNYSLWISPLERKITIKNHYQFNSLEKANPIIPFSCYLIPNSTCLIKYRLLSLATNEIMDQGHFLLTKDSDWINSNTLMFSEEDVARFQALYDNTNQSVVLELDIYAFPLQRDIFIFQK